MNRTACCGVVLASVGLLGWAAAQGSGPAAKREVAAARGGGDKAAQPAALTAEERAFVGNWAVDLDAVAKMSDPSWVHNSVPEYELVRVDVRADHTAFAATPKGEYWFRWAVRDGALVDADTDADNGMIRLTVRDGAAYVNVKAGTNYFNKEPLPLRSVQAANAIDPAALQGVWKFSYTATRAVDEAIKKERERVNAIDKDARHESLESRIKQLFPDSPPTFELYKTANSANINVMPDDNTQRVTSGQSEWGPYKAFSYGTWEDMVVLFNHDGWAYIKPNTQVLRMVDGRLHWRVHDETLVFERDLPAEPKAGGR